MARQAATTPERAKSTLQQAETTLQQATPADSPIIASLGNLAALVFLTMTTKPTFLADFKPGGGGKTAVYMARWVKTREKKGPWSEIATAKVAT